MTDAGSASDPPRTARRFRAAAAAAGGVVAIAVVLAALEPVATAERFLRPLVATGFLCLAILARFRLQGLAWLSLVAAGLVAAGVPIAIARAADPDDVGLAEWLVVAARAIVAAVATASIAALYATRPDRYAGRGVATVATVIVAWLVGAFLLVVLLVVAGTGTDPAFTWIDVATSPTALFLHLVLLLTAFGVIGDLRAASGRAEQRRALADLPPFWRGGGPASLVERTVAIARELMPGAADAGDAAGEAERTRLAGDLHAVVLPGLRRAIAEAESGGRPEVLAERLRSIDADLARLMADRWPVVLETFGLIQAVEELAERIEAEAAVTVELEIELDAGRPPRSVELAAWRIAQLALDNAARHAAASRIVLRVATAPEIVRLVVADDGRGLDPAAASDAARAGARGLADLARRAAAVGGSLGIGPGENGGTEVRFEWPAVAAKDATG